MNSAVISALVTGIFSVLITIMTIWSMHHLNAKRNEKQRRKEEQITDNDISQMCEIQEYLDTLAEKWIFDRAAIYQFHNGGKFFNGVAMKKFSLTRMYYQIMDTQMCLP